MKVMVGFLFQSVLRFFHYPARVLWLSLAILFFSLLVDGNFIRLWSLYRHKDRLVQEIQQVEKKSQRLQVRIQQAQHLEFIERKARDELDLVQKDELIFVFSGQE